MRSIIRVRDVARNKVYDFGPDEPILRGPYELFQPVGAVQRRGALVDWLQGNVIRSARVVPNVLGDTRPGERVLLRLPPVESDDEWWLCDVQAVDGASGAE